MQPETRRVIPVLPAETAHAGACDGDESFALMVLGDSMLPEFAEGDVIVVEPGGVVKDASFVLAFVDEEWTLRQLTGQEGRWTLRALNPAYAALAIPDMSCIRGVITQKAVPGRRRAGKRYVD